MYQFVGMLYYDVCECVHHYCTVPASMCPLSSLIRNRTATGITCTTPNVMSVGSGPIVIQIDNEVIQNGGVTFEYRSNPTFTSVMPQKTIHE